MRRLKSVHECRNACFSGFYAGSRFCPRVWPLFPCKFFVNQRYRLLYESGKPTVWWLRPGYAGPKGVRHAMTSRNSVCRPAGANPARSKPSPAGR